MPNHGHVQQEHQSTGSSNTPCKDNYENRAQKVRIIVNQSGIGRKRTMHLFIRLCCFGFYNRQFRIKALNCINSQWSWTNCWNRLAIVDRFFRRFAASLIVFKSFFISLINGNSIEHVPNPKVPKHLQTIITFITSVYWIETAIKYLNGVLGSKGNLKLIRERKKWNAVNKSVTRKLLPHRQW